MLVELVRISVVMSLPTVSLSNMVDLALGSPEIGAVNFNVLHSLLHVVLDQLNIAHVRAPLPAEPEDAEPARTGRQDGTVLHRGRREASDVESDSGVVGGLTSASEGGTGFSADQPGKQDSEKPTAALMKTPLHQLQERVGRMERQLTDLNSLPSTKELIDSTGEERNRGVRPVADMWQGMQLSRKVDANTQGVSKVRRRS